jgi:hypothetical protein
VINVVAKAEIKEDQIVHMNCSRTLIIPIFAVLLKHGRIRRRLAGI